ncbi:uncharacterized protein LOC144877698 [Branchiostoma floridae x Branchiostoma japonicum]
MPRSKRSVEKRRKQRTSTSTKRKTSQLSPEAAEAKRAYKNEKMQEYRSKETKETSNKRLADKRAYMKKKRQKETLQATQERRAEMRSYTNKRRREETQEAAQKRRAEMRANTNKRRREETQEAAQKRRAEMRANTKKRRREETQEAAQKRRAEMRANTKKRRREETQEAAQKRRAEMRANTKKRRREETEEATQKRRAELRANTKKRRREETQEATQKRRAEMRANMKRRRREETQEAAQKRRAANRTKMKQCRKSEQSKEITIEECANAFHTKIADGPIFACISCCRLLYRCTVLEYKASNYSSNQVIEKILKFVNDMKTNEKSWICRTCHTALKQGNVPTQSRINDMELDVIPEELKELRPLELRLISQRIAFMKMVGLPRGGQKAIHGSAVNVPSKLQPVISLLPRLPESAEVVPFKLKRKLCYKGHYMHQYIRPQCVMKALRWLQENNPLYRDISICKDWESQWKDSEGDLWDAMTNNVREQNIDEGGNTVHDTGSGLTACPASPLHGSSETTVTLGLMGELHYVALEEAEAGVRLEMRQEIEDEEDRVAAEETCKLRGIPYDSLLQEEEVVDGRRINAGLMKNQNTIDQMLRTDTAVKFMKSIRGSPSFWNSALLDLLGMLTCNGLK